MKKVLVLEDEANIRSFVVINLKRAGYEAVEAETGEEALEQLRKMISDKTISEDSFAKISGGPQDGQCLKIGKIIADQPDQKIKTAEFLSSGNGGIRIACPDCGQHFSVTEDLFKVTVFKCSKCGIKFRLPPRADSTTEFISNVPYVDLDSSIPDGDLLCPHCWKSFDQDLRTAFVM